MSGLKIERIGNLAEVSLHRGKVNALDEIIVGELRTELRNLTDDDSVGAVVLSGSGSFFSFGFDVPALFGYSENDFKRFVTAFTDLYTELFVLPKPVVAALNGHSIAGGCMLALACDARLMASSGAKISLNEITFGASVFAGSVEMLVACVGQQNATALLYGGAMLSADEARELGLVDQVVGQEELTAEARSVAGRLAAKDPVAFASLKGLLREPIAERMRRREQASIDDFVKIWYSESTRRQLERITIRGA